MKGFARRNQLIITGLAIMIAVAGYLHFTSEEGAELSEAGPETAGMEDTQWLSEDEAAEYILTDDDDSVETMSRDEYADISAEDIGEDDDGEKVVAEITDTGADDSSMEDTGDGSSPDSESGDGNGTTGDGSAEQETAETGSSIGEAVLVNNTIKGDYFSSAKLSREQARAKNEETLMEIVNSAKMEEAQKQEAVSSLIELTEISEMEMAAETLLGAKGFQNVIVTITEESVDVVVDAESLTKQQLVQIQDIVRRKTNVAVENIVITPVAVEE